MLNGYVYKWIDVTNWEFARINEETRRLAHKGWLLDGVIDIPSGGRGKDQQHCINLRFRRRAAA